MNQPSGSVEMSATPTEEAQGLVRRGRLLMTCHQACLSLWGPRPAGGGWKGGGVGRGSSWRVRPRVSLCVTVCHCATAPAPQPPLLPMQGVVLSPRLWQTLLALCPGPPWHFCFCVHCLLHLIAPAALPGSFSCPLSTWAVLGHWHLCSPRAAPTSESRGRWGNSETPRAPWEIDTTFIRSFCSPPRLPLLYLGSPGSPPTQPACT